MLDLVKVADVLDAAADHLEAIDAEKVSSVQAERKTRIDQLASKYAETTGEELPEGVRSKLASSDKDVVALINTMIQKQASTVEVLGGPSSRGDGSEPQTVKEAADQAEDRFLSWIMS